jgi:nucleotide-binding universal stress UspA family protein
MTGSERPTPAPLQDILVYADTTPPTRTALEWAGAVAGDGNVSCLMFGFLAPYPMTVYMEATPDIWLQAQRRAEAIAAESEASVRAMTQGLAHPVEFRRRDVMEGEAGRILGQEGRYADAIVIGWPAKGGESFDRTLFAGALFNSGGPVILVPEGHRTEGPPRRILVAWSPEKEAARAVRDALALLKQAETVRLVAVASGAPQGEPDPGADAARHLARHDVQVEMKQAVAGGRSIAETLKEEARYLGADLLVMGGYGHSRLAEWILGGVTRDMLADLKLPVLFAH